MAVISCNQARTALYLDFEATAKPTAPALLGVLVGAQFRHYVVDPILHDAARVAPDCGATDLQPLLASLAAQMVKADTVWSSWSRFDLHVIQDSGVPAGIIDVFARRHRNALDLVPQWARMYGVRPSRVRFQARNQMHKFFNVAGYRPDWRYTQATPADWIRQTRKRMTAAGGDYGAVSRTARRDWHALLTYNRHDCVGLRHLVLRAAAETEKRSAYLATEYSVQIGTRRVKFRIGSNSRQLDGLVTSREKRHWAHMTAWNPGLIELSASENASRQEALLAEARLRGYEAAPGDGRDPDDRRPAEVSALILGIGKDEARELGRKYGQWAVVVGRVGEKSELQWCLDRGADPLVVNQLAFTE